MSHSLPLSLVLSISLSRSRASAPPGLSALRRRSETRQGQQEQGAEHRGRSGSSAEDLRQRCGAVTETCWWTMKHPREPGRSGFAAKPGCPPPPNKPPRAPRSLAAATS